MIYYSDKGIVTRYLSLLSATVPDLQIRELAGPELLFYVTVYGYPPLCEKLL